MDINQQESFVVLTEQGFKLQLFWLPWQLANLAIDYLVFAGRTWHDTRQLEHSLKER